jgi:FkbM family methyltransferase
MLIPISNLSQHWKIKPNGVLHVGAHRGEEAGEYEKYGWGKVVWVEAQPTLVSALRSALDIEQNLVLEAAVWNESGVELDFNVASNGESSSLLEFGSHADSYPNITFLSRIKVLTKRLDEIIPAERFADFLNLDLQGAELRALQGLGERISEFNWVYSEVNKIEVYRDCALITEIDGYLERMGFVRVSTRWVFGKGWGDALYIREGHPTLGKPNYLIEASKFMWTWTQIRWSIKAWLLLVFNTTSIRKKSKKTSTKIH